MANTKNRRQTVVVNRSLQRKIILAITLSPSIAVTGAAMLVAIFCRRLQGEATAADVELPSLLPLFVVSLGFTVFAALGMIYQALHFSHRVAGPAYRFIRSMEQIRGGDIGFRVQLRKGDHLVEVADEMNRMLEWLNANPPSTDGLRTDADSAVPDKSEAKAEPVAT